MDANFLIPQKQRPAVRGGGTVARTLRSLANAVCVLRSNGLGGATLLLAMGVLGLCLLMAELVYSVATAKPSDGPTAEPANRQEPPVAYPVFVGGLQRSPEQPSRQRRPLPSQDNGVRQWPKYR